MRARKYTYIPNDEIESITTWNGKEIPGSKLLDGAYARGKVQYGEGGQIKYGVVEESTDRILIIDTDKSFIDKKYKELKEVYEKYPNEKISIVEFINSYANGGMMGDGGEIRRFDRHKQMDAATRDEILDTIKEFHLIDGFSNLQNYLYGLFVWIIYVCIIYMDYIYMDYLYELYLYGLYLYGLFA